MHCHNAYNGPLYGGGDTTWDKGNGVVVTCSMKFCDNFLVQLNMLSHFRGLILCSVKLPQFQKNKKQELKGKS